MKLALFTASAALLLAACQTPHTFATPDASWRRHTGQLKYTSGDQVLVGEVVVRQRGASDFQLDFLKGGAFPLLRLRMDATTARAEGPLARGSWQGAPQQAPAHLQAWVALREKFAANPGATALEAATADRQFIFHLTR